MKKSQNNAIWRIYLFVLAFSIISAGTFLYLKWVDIKLHASIEQTYSNNLVTRSIETVLRKNELMLKVLGERFLELLETNQPNIANQVMAKVMRSNPELVGLALISTQGDFLLTSENFKVQSLPNLASKSETKDSFRSALDSEHLVMGRTYYLEALGEWVIPIRLKVTNKEGTRNAVVATGFRLGDVDGIWSSDSLPDHLRMVVIRADMYRQYVSFIDPKQYEDWYEHSVPERFVEYVDRLFTKQAGISLSDIRLGQQMATIIVPNKVGELNLATASFDPVYGHYTIVSTPLSFLYGKMVTPSSWVLLLLVLFNIGLYFIFRLNANMQLQAKRSLQLQVEHDLLTGLPNRRFLAREFQFWLKRHQQGFALLFIDLNNFKSSNDLHGHSVGDHILKEVAERTKRYFKRNLCIRQGGDEFIVLSPDLDTQVLELKCKAYLEELSETITVHHLEFSITASIGIALYPNDGKDMEELLRKADMAMYEAKRKQRPVLFYSEDLEQKAKHKAQIEKELSSALDKQELFVVYQPQVDAVTKQVLGVEALVRWQSPSLGFVPPDQFISVAEANGEILEIGRFVIEQAIKDCKDVVRSVPQFEYKLRVSVNVSVRQLLNDGFIRLLRELNKALVDEPITLLVEVTESLFIEDLGKAKEVLDQVKECGIYTSLDDFGTGYSSLSVLSKLPLNELKIDRSFVNDILEDEQDWMLAKSIINLSKSLSIPVVAEGVETKEQAELLAKHGCDVFQGYYFAKPMRKQELIEFLLCYPSNNTDK